jgi:ribokinase
VHREGTIAIPAPAVDVVDTVGAGDALNGSLAAGLASGLKLEAALRRAVVAASLAVTKAGAREGMPTTQELKRAVTRARPSA